MCVSCALATCPNKPTVTDRYRVMYTYASPRCGRQNPSIQSLPPTGPCMGALALAPSVHWPIRPSRPPNTACAHGTALPPPPPGHHRLPSSPVSHQLPAALPALSAMPPSRVSLRRPARDGTGARRVHRHRSPPPPVARGTGGRLGAAAARDA